MRSGRDENLVDLETDKVVLEVPSPADGVLKDQVRRRLTVTSQQVIAVIEARSPPRPPLHRLQPRDRCNPDAAPAKAAATPACLRRQAAHPAGAPRRQYSAAANGREPRRGRAPAPEHRVTRKTSSASPAANWPRR